MKPIKLFFYKPLITVDHLNQLIGYLNQKIWFTRLSDFNDPFEARFNFKMATAREILETPETFDRYLCELTENNVNLTAENLKESLSTPEADQHLGKMRPENNFFQQHAAICLTKSFSNIPMWAHYAHYHQGYCVTLEINLDFFYRKYKEEYEKNGPEYTLSEFELVMRKVFEPKKDGSDKEIISFNQSLDSEKHFIFGRVTYQDKKPVIEETVLDRLRKTSGYEYNKYFFNNSIGVKFKQWEYEDEYRLLSNAHSKKSGLMDLQSYCAESMQITEITIGSKIGTSLNPDLEVFFKTMNIQSNGLQYITLEEQMKDFLLKKCKEKNIKIYQAILHDEEYEITRDEMRD